MLDNPEISVIMSVYNGEKYLRDAIESILNQTFTDFEFIIVNDGSTDTSFEIIKSYNDERIKIINNEKNIGLTKSLNKALKVARGEYIARQDADDISLPNRFEEQLKYLEKHPEVALLGTSVSHIEENGKITGKNILLANPSIDDFLKDNLFKHGSTMFKKEIVNKLGGYNDLFKYAQDYELWLRIAKHFEVRGLAQLLYKIRSHNEKIGITNIEESTLYRLLALRLAKNELDEEIFKSIKDNGIKSLYSHLSKNEKMVLHNAIAGVHIYTNKRKQARAEYKKRFTLNPFDVKSIVGIIISYIGKDAYIRSSKIYAAFRNIIVYLKNKRLR
jgi:glycosyltransferase involved in cell wall biosynthesis